MSEPKKEIIKTFDGTLIVTESKVRHPKSKEMVDYLSFSDGMSVSGVFLDKNTKKELSKFLNKKESKDGTSSES